MRQCLPSYHPQIGLVPTLYGATSASALPAAAPPQLITSAASYGGYRPASLYRSN